MKDNKKDWMIFKALSDEKRLFILKLLKKGEKCACKLLEDMDICQSSLSYHMKILVESGIVTGRQDGKWTHYSISKKGSEYAVELLKTLTTAEDEGTKAECCDNKSA